MTDRVLHCWEGQLDAIEAEHGYLSDAYNDAVHRGLNGICMLEAAHEGPHEFTNPEEIVVIFDDDPMFCEKCEVEGPNVQPGQRSGKWLCSRCAAEEKQA